MRHWATCVPKALRFGRRKGLSITTLEPSAQPFEPESRMIFVSYSRRDEKWLDRFQDVFKPLSTYAELDLWSDRRIKPGDDWKSEINRAMNAAYAAVAGKRLFFGI
jgi:hypothetical protein